MSHPPPRWRNTRNGKTKWLRFTASPRWRSRGAGTWSTPDRVAQLVIQRVEEVAWNIVDSLDGVDRGGGFGQHGVQDADAPVHLEGGDEPLDRPGTKFERRGLRHGHRIWDWRFVRSDDEPDGLATREL